MTPSTKTFIELARALRKAQGGTVTLPVSTVEWLRELAYDAHALALASDLTALGTIERFDAGPQENIK